MKKKFLVTGGGGFIGQNIVNLLSKKNNSIIIIDNNFRNINQNLKKNKNIKFYKRDIRKKNKISKLFFNVDAVVHLAYINGTEFFYKYPVDVLEVAIKGLMNVLDLCVENKIKELYLASSSEVYHLAKTIPTKEDNVELKIPDVRNPRYSYACGKILTEVAGIHYGKKFFKKLIIFRPHNVYGPNMGNEHVIPQLINKIKKIKDKKNTIKIQGSGNEIRTFIYIDDFISGFEKIISNGKHLNIYNIGTTERIKIKNLTKLIAKIMLKKIVLKKGKLKKGSTPIRCPNVNKIKSIGFKKKYNLLSGLKKTIEWYNKY
jgi:nucleoside-diphosphate-sugar epimerase